MLNTNRARIAFVIFAFGIFVLIWATSFIPGGIGVETPSVNSAGGSPSVVVFDQELADCLSENAGEFYSRYLDGYRSISRPESVILGNLAATYAEAVCIPPAYYEVK